MKWIPIALFCAVAGPAAAAAPAPSATPPSSLEGAIAVGDWTFVGNSDTTVMFYKPVAAGGAYPRVQVRFEDGAPFTREGFSSLASLELDDVDCAGKRTRILESTRFKQRNMTGERHVDPIESPVWKSEAPGSFGAGLIAKVCATLN